MYRLTFNLFSYEDEFWTHVTGVDDLVVEEDKPSKKRSGIFSTKTIKKNTPAPIHNSVKSSNLQKKKLHFLYSQLKSVMETQELKVQAAKKRVCLLYNLTWIKGYFAGNKLEQEIVTWLQAVEQSFKQIMYESIIGLLPDIAKFRKMLRDVTNNKEVPLPISDLSGYLEEGEYLDARKYVDAFANQFKTNYDLLDQLNFARIRHRLNLLCTSIDQTFQQRLANLFSGNMVSQLDLLYRHVNKLKDEISDMLTLVEQHLSFCQNVLESIHLDSFSERTVLLVNYFVPHKETLKKVFGGTLKPVLPLTVPNITLMKDVTVEITNEQEFHYFKQTYDQMVPIVEKMESAVPTKWPQTLPNLSTHDGKPRLTARNQADYSLILGSYSEYLGRVEKVRGEWIISVRTCYKFLASTECFYDPNKKMEPEELLRIEMSDGIPGGGPVVCPTEIDGVVRTEKEKGGDIGSDVVPNLDDPGKIPCGRPVRSIHLVKRPRIRNQLGNFALASLDESSVPEVFPIHSKSAPTIKLPPGFRAKTKTASASQGAPTSPTSILPACLSPTSPTSTTTNNRSRAESSPSTPVVSKSYGTTTIHVTYPDSALPSCLSNHDEAHSDSLLGSKDNILRNSSPSLRNAMQLLKKARQTAASGSGGGDDRIAGGGRAGPRSQGERIIIQESGNTEKYG